MTINTICTVESLHFMGVQFTWVTLPHKFQITTKYTIYKIFLCIEILVPNKTVKFPKPTNIGSPQI